MGTWIPFNTQDPTNLGEKQDRRRFSCQDSDMQVAPTCHGSQAQRQSRGHTDRMSGWCWPTTEGLRLEDPEDLPLARSTDLLPGPCEAALNLSPGASLVPA